jgi:hypothetical protein
MVDEIKDEWVSHIIETVLGASESALETKVSDALLAIGEEIYEEGGREGLQASDTPDGRWQAGMANAADICDFSAMDCLDELCEFGQVKYLVERFQAQIDILEQVAQ